MLDTNVISAIVSRNPNIINKLQTLSSDEICISSMVSAEIFYGLAKKPNATRLRQNVLEVLARIQVMPFAEKEAEFYGQFRADIEKTGKNLAEMDLLIASHAHYLGAVLVTSDKAFAKIKGLKVESWG